MVAGHRILRIGVGLAVLVVLLTLTGLLLGYELTQAQNGAPTVAGVAVTSNAGDDDTYLLGEVIQVTVTFSETVNVTGSPQLAIDMDPAEWGEKWASYHSGSGTANLTFTHTVVEPNISTQGIAVLANTLELNGGSIRSASSQTDAALSHTGLAHDAEHKVDWRRSPPAPTPTPTPEPTPTPTPPPAPSITSVTVSSNAGDDDTYLLGETIRITLTFSETVDVAGSPQLAIDMDPAEWGEKWAGYHSGSGTASLAFTHTVVEPNLSTQGIAVLANTLGLNGGTIRSAASQTDADLSHTGLAHNPSHKVDWRRSPPAPTPTPAPEPTPTPTPPSDPAVTEVEITSDAGDDNAYGLGDVIRITVTFSEAVNVTGAPRLKIDMDPAEWGEKQAGYRSGNGTANLTFGHAVVEPNISTQGIAVLANSLELNGGSIKSATSQADADLSHTGLAHDPSHKVDWRREPGQPNRAPVINTGTWNYQRFIGNNNAPRGILVSKSFYQVFTDPDGDELTYSVSIPDHHRQLLDEFSIGLDYRTPENSHRSLEVFHRVWFRAEDDTDWKGISPALADPVVVTATVTATDPEGLSVSLEGDFLIWWDSYPEVVSAMADAQAIALTFDVAVEDDPAPTPGQFTVHVVNGDGTTGTVSVSGMTVNGAVVTLGLATELASRQVVTVDYAHDVDTPLQRAGGGDPAPDFSGQAVATLPDAVANLAVSSTAGQLALSAAWDALQGATSYKLRWREVGGAFEAANAITVSDTTAAITVSGYGRWEVRVQGCNVAGCGPEAAATVDATAPLATSLHLAPARLTDAKAPPELVTASWPAVPGATSQNLRWGRDVADAQEWNNLNLPGDRTSADFTVEGPGKHKVSLEAHGPEDQLITAYHGHVDVRVTSRVNARVYSVRHQHQALGCQARTIDGLQVVFTSNGIELNWDDPGISTITKYQIRVESDGGLSLLLKDDGGWTDIPGSHAGTTSYTLTDLVMNWTYGVWIVAVAGDRYYCSGSYAWITPFDVSIPLLTNFRNSWGGTVEGQYLRFSLSWDDPNDDTLSYEYWARGREDRPWWVPYAGDGPPKRLGSRLYASISGLSCKNSRYDFRVRPRRGDAIGSSRMTFHTPASIQGTGNDDTLHGSIVGDCMVGWGGNDTLYGGHGNDMLYGGRGNDYLDGGTGDDHLNGGAGADQLHGGSEWHGRKYDINTRQYIEVVIPGGSDTADYSSSGSGVTVNLATGVRSGGHAQGDTFTSIENVTGSAHNDALTGDNHSNVLRGGHGDDVLHGKAGGDVLDGGGGADALNGGDGDDTADYSASAAAVSINLVAGTGSGGNAQGDTLTGIENLTGSDHDDTLTGNASGNVLWGGAGADTLNGGDGNDILRGNDGNDILRGNDGDDTVHGGAGQDYLYGGSGDDKLYAIVSSDQLRGDAGNDKLHAVSGQVIIFGGEGSDEFYHHVESFNSITQLRDFALSEQIYLCMGTASNRPTWTSAGGTLGVVTGHFVTVTFDGSELGKFFLQNISTTTANLNITALPTTNSRCAVP